MNVDSNAIQKMSGPTISDTRHGEAVFALHFERNSRRALTSLHAAFRRRPKGTAAAPGEVPSALHEYFRNLSRQAGNV